MKPPPPLISIGTLARATGIRVERLRIWESRYGAPLAQRLPGGHRRYPRAEVERLVLLQACLRRGERPREVAAWDSPALLSHLDQVAAAGTDPHRGRPWDAAAWVRAAERMDGPWLRGAFEAHQAELGCVAFLTQRAAPFLDALGRGWAGGAVCVAAEHFGSEALGAHLSAGLRVRPVGSDAGPVLVTTLPGDAHRLGALMAAVVSADAGVEALFLGPSTPVEEIAAAASASGCWAVCLSVSVALEPARAAGLLQDLSGRLAPDVGLVVGGAGAPAPGPGQGWTRVRRLETFSAWMRAGRSARTLDAAEPCGQEAA